MTGAAGRQPRAPIPFPGNVRRPERPRVRPAGTAGIGAVNAVLCRAIAIRFGTPVPNVFTTLGRHRRLFRAWLRFAARLMPYGTLDRADTELVILRVAVNCGSDYEWYQHVTLARRAGLTTAQIERVGAGRDAPGWSGHQRALLAAVDEFTAARVIGDATWAALSRKYAERQLIEVCLLIGQYEMLAATLNSLGVQPDG